MSFFLLDAHPVLADGTSDPLGYCANPLSIANSQFCKSSADVTLSACCPETHDSYGEPGYPVSYSECSTDYFSQTDETVEGKCTDKVCCLPGAVSEETCYPQTIRGRCLVTYNGTAYETETCAGISECSNACCCYNETDGTNHSTISIQQYCESYDEHYYNTIITDAEECASFCGVSSGGTPPPTDPLCSDGDDNDGDGLEDYADPGCCPGGTYDPNDNSEDDVYPQCSNDFDDDEDGDIDEEDSCCWVSGAYNPQGTSEGICDYGSCVMNSRTTVDCACGSQICEAGSYCCQTEGCIQRPCGSGCTYNLPCGTSDPVTGCPLFKTCLPDGSYEDVCRPDPSCGKVPEVCDNNIDDDGNGLVDCLDIRCNGLKCSSDDISECESKGYYSVINGNYQCCYSGIMDCNDDGTPDACGSCDCNTYKTNPILSPASLRQGEDTLTLSWAHDCNVDFFLFRKCTGSNCDTTSGNYYMIAGPLTSRSFSDSSLKPESRYSYYVEAVYSDGTSKKSNEVNISTGSEICMRVPYKSFCLDEALGEEGKRIIIASCDVNNRVVANVNCEESEGEGYLCMGPYSNGEARCVYQSRCDSCGEPFNMFSDYTSSRCSDGSSEEYCKDLPTCYYDFSDTTIDKFSDCREIYSCYDYNSEDACTGQGSSQSNSNNRCLNRDCEWVGIEGDGLEYGFCLETVDYFKDCSECTDASFNAIFGGCTQENCQLFGDCSLRLEDNMCLPNDATSCDDYESKSRCTGSRVLDVDVTYSGGERTGGTHEIESTSADTYGYGVCRWDDTKYPSKPCFKDGDGNLERDSGVAWDKSPPVTRILTPHKSVNLNISFITSDFGSGGSAGSSVSNTYFCKTESESQACYPDNSEANYDERGFGWIELGGSGGIYYIYYYSVDNSDNLEVVQRYKIDIDRTPPTINITAFPKPNYESPLNSGIIFSVKTDEDAYCTDHFENVPSSQIQNNFGRSWVTNYNGLSDGYYDYKVECTDSVGNKADKTITVKLDADPRVFDTLPTGAINSSSVQLKAKTVAEGASCRWDYSVKSYDSMTHEFSKEEINIGGSTVYLHSANINVSESRKYSIDVKCRISGTVSDDEIQFVYDVIPPNTVIYSSTPGVVFNPAGWYTEAGLEGKVFLGCNDTPENGFGCNYTKYCVSTTQNRCTPSTLAYADRAVVFPEDTGGPITFCYVSRENIVNGMGGLYEKDGEQRGKCNELKLDTHPPRLRNLAEIRECNSSTSIRQECTTFLDKFLIKGEAFDPDSGTDGISNNIVRITVTRGDGKVDTYDNIPANRYLPLPNNQYNFKQYVNLSLGTNTIKIYITDRSGASSGANTYYVHVANYTGEKIRLITPANGVSLNPVFNLTVWSYREAECRYSFLETTGYANSVVMSMSTEEGDEGKLEYFHTKQIDLSDNGAGSENPIHIRCKAGDLEFEREFVLSWDNRKPEIESIILNNSDMNEPPTIIEYPLESELIVDTSIETRCKYSDDKTLGFDSVHMKKFDGYDNGNLSTKNKVLLSSLADKSSYTYYITCESGAGLKSTTETFRFNVDTSLNTGFTYLSPPKKSSNSTFKISVRSSKSADSCKAEISPASGQGTTTTHTLSDVEPDPAHIHKSGAITLDEGRYNIALECTSADKGKVTSSYTFLIDTTPPDIPEIDDGNTSRYRTLLSASFSSEDNLTKVTSYNYSIGTFDNLTAISDWALTSRRQVTKRNLNLSKGETYYWSVYAMNEVGLWSEIGISDGVLIIDDITEPNGPNLCANGVLDAANGETDIDCGGSNCDRCQSGEKCVLSADCISKICIAGICRSGNCSDNIKNQDETDVDCGGKSCMPCDIDHFCKVDSDCSSKYCRIDRCAMPRCDDGIKNGDEESVDCGGSCGTDCPKCDDGVRNGDEEGIDCGGSQCEPCDVGVSEEEKCFSPINQKLDTDCDGMDDDWEKAYSLDMLYKDSDEDSDGDGISNGDEYLNGTDPTVADKRGASWFEWFKLPLIVLLAIILSVLILSYGYVFYTQKTGKRISAVDNIIRSVAASRLYTQVRNLFSGKGTASRQKQAYAYPNQMYAPGAANNLPRQDKMPSPYPGGAPNIRQSQRTAPEKDMSAKELVNYIRKKRQQEKKAGRESYLSAFSEKGKVPEPTKKGLLSKVEKEFSDNNKGNRNK